MELRECVKRAKLAGKIINYASIGAAALAVICWAVHYGSTTLSYAKLGPQMELHRDTADPNTLSLLYEPRSGGKFGVLHESEGRITELYPRTILASGASPQFRWRAERVKTGDAVTVTSLNGLMLGSRSLTVPEYNPPGGLPTVNEMGAPGSASSEPFTGAALSGRVVSAIDGDPLPLAEVSIGGTPLRATTDREGSFRIVGIPGGSHKVAVSAGGHAPSEFDRELVEGEEKAFQIALKPSATGDDIRIVLEWKRGAGDLDAHLEGPLPGSKKFHVDYHHPGDEASKKVVEVVADSKADGGPETIEVKKVVPGTYRYFVHDFGNRHDPASTALSGSEAEVTVAYAGQHYRFSPSRDQKGNLWDVCTIEVKPDGGVVNRINNYLGIKAEVLGLYDRRTQDNRDTWITNYGGSAESEGAVAEGLDWLARHQHPDGFWSNECLAAGKSSRCKADPCSGPGDKYEIAQTGLALLAFQAGGYYYSNGRRYSDQVRKGLDYLVAHQQSDGALVSEKQTKGGHSKGYHTYYMYDHGIATFALADACAAAKALGKPPDPKYLRALKNAVTFLYSQQHKDGGWRYSDKLEEYSDTSVTGWQVLALKSAREAGAGVDPRVVDKIRDLFQRCKMPDHGRTFYENRGSTSMQQSDATTGIGMLARQFLFGEPDAPMIPEAAEYLASLAEKHQARGTVEKRGTDPDKEYFLGYNYYLWYKCTMAMFQAGGKPWDRWNPIIRNTVIKLQQHKGCEKGSWNPDSQWCERGGRIYTTALACLTLETYYRYTKTKEIKEGGAGEGANLLVVSPGEIPHLEVAKPEPVELHIRGDQMIQEVPIATIPVATPVVRSPLPVVAPPVSPGPLMQPGMPAPPGPQVQQAGLLQQPPIDHPRRSGRVGGAKIITVGAATYGDVGIEAEIEEKPTSFHSRSRSRATKC